MLGLVYGLLTFKNLVCAARDAAAWCATAHALDQLQNNVKVKDVEGEGKGRGRQRAEGSQRGVQHSQLGAALSKMQGWQRGISGRNPPPNPTRNPVRLQLTKEKKQLWQLSPGYLQWQPDKKSSSCDDQQHGEKEDVENAAKAGTRHWVRYQVCLGVGRAWVQ